MTHLIHPITKQPCEFVASERGYVALRCDYVSPQVRWFTLAQIEAANPVATCAEPPQPLTVVLSPEMAAHVNASANVVIVVRQPAPVISLWADGLRVA